MISDRIKVTSEEKNIESILELTERFAKVSGLESKKALHLLLLSEELVGLISGITTDFSGEFWIESTDDVYNICMEAETLVNKKKRDDLLALSSSGENIKVKGIMGRIRGIFEGFMLTYDEYDQRNLMMTQAVPYSVGGMVDIGAYRSMESQVWTLSQFKSNIEEKKGEEQQAMDVWDELEKSVVAKIADDVEVGIRGSKVDVIIRKKM